MAKNKDAICLAILPSLARYHLLILALLLLTGCQKTLVFFEQTAFKLGISVNEEPPVPLEVTVGLKRRVVAISPPKKPLEQGSPVSEAVSLLSRFDVIYDPDETDTAGPGNPFGGTLRIISAFASGDAAVTIAGDPIAIAAVVKPESVEEVIRSFRGAEGPITLIAPPPEIPGAETAAERALAASQLRDFQAFLCVGVDGDFGPETRAAIRMWQNFKGYPDPARREGNLDAAQVVDLIADSTAGACDRTTFRNVYERMQYGEEADVIGLTENLGLLGAKESLALPDLTEVRSVNAPNLREAIRIAGDKLGIDTKGTVTPEFDDKLARALS